MHVAVIGNSGQVAQALRLALLPTDLSLRAHGRPGVDLTRHDTLDTVINRASKPSLVVNAAAYTDVDGAETDIKTAFAVNFEGVVATAQLCAKSGIPLIHFSTDYVFDGTKNGPYSEVDPTNPLGVYGRSKLEGEHAVRAACPSNIVLRTAWVISPFGRNFVTTMLRLMAERDTLNVVDDQIGSPTSALDLADAIIRIAGESGKGGGTYHLVGQGSTSWFGLATEIRNRAVDIFGSDWSGAHCRIEAIPTSDYPTAAKRPANSVLSTEAFTQTFGFTLPRWQDSLTTILTAIKKQNET